MVQEPLSTAPPLTRCAAASASTVLEESYTNHPQKDSASLAAAHKFSLPPFPMAGTLETCACPQGTFGSRSW